MAFDWSSENLDREFPVRRNLAYWNHAAVAPLPRRVAEAIVAHTENVRDRGAADWRAWYRAIDETRGKAARLIGARTPEIAFLPSTSWALNFVAQAFPWKSGDNVVGDDMEFPANVYPWMLLEGRGVEYRLARNRGGRIGVDEVAALVDSRTRAVAVSWVAFHNGWVYPIEEIGAFCREKGILFVVDAIQGLGALPIDVAEANVDVLAADAHKWLFGPEACAVFYVSERARERVPPAFGGWWNVKHEASHAGGYLDYKLDFHLGGRRYEPGSLPTAQIMGLAAALDLLREMTVEEISRRIVEVVRRLSEGLAERGWKVTTPEPFRSGILAAVP
ncbi:MAG TPA: aminotransferase class V-fold PLP-dependent enzyme, partial [Thermoanaerobaculia bacterium]|nr:aminotransferase class V-fold PLP-dependent enzyme [Thermoanaerobaculia bacterium]